MTWKTETLMEDTAWMTRLARRLASDWSTADDLVQDAWALALRREARPPRAWLATVLRKLSFTRERSAARRSRREERASQANETLDVCEGVARVEAQQRLAAALLRVDEPFRSALIWHHMDGLSPKAIADRSGAPLGTVHSRLTRGLGKLGRELGRSNDEGRDAWLFGLGPLIRVSSVDRKVMMIGASWGIRALAAASVLLVALLVWFGPSLSPPPPPGVDMSEVGAGPFTPDPLESSRTPIEGEQRTSVVSLEARGLAPGGSENPAGWSLALTVLRPDSTPASGASVYLAIAHPNSSVTVRLGSTDLFGRLTCPLKRLDDLGIGLQLSGEVSLLIYHPDHFSLMHRLDVSEFDLPGQFDATVTLPDDPHLTGIVCAPDGTRVDGAICRLVSLDEIGRGIQVAFTLSGSGGRFCLPVRSESRGFVVAESPDGSATTPTLNLAEARDVGALVIQGLKTLRGRVVDPTGQPSPRSEVYVAWDGDSAAWTRHDGSGKPGIRWAHGHADQQGYFELKGLRAGAYKVRLSSADKDRRSVSVVLPCPEVLLVTERPRLLVRVKDVDGREALGVEVAVTQQEEALQGETPHRESGDAASSYAHTQGSPAVASFPVDPGRVYSIEATDSEGLGICATSFGVPLTGYLHRIELILGVETTASCSLRVRAFSSSGERITAFRVSLYDPSGRGELRGFADLVPGSGGWFEKLPAGDFKARLHLDPALARERGLWLSDAERDVQLRPETGSELQFQVELGGTIEFAIDVERWPTGSPLVGDPGSADWAAWLRQHGVEIDVMTLALDAGPVRDAARERLLVPSDRPGQVGLVHWFPPDRSSVAWKVRPPGRYAYRVSGAAWVSVEGEVELRPGQRTRVRVRLAARS